MQKLMALSFYVKSSGTGTYMCVEDHDNGRNNQQQFSVTYNNSSTNTWERKMH